jgi:excisionase family DNA binding protein
MPVNHKLAYSVAEAVGVSGLSRSRLYKAIAERQLRSFKDGRTRKLTHKALEEFVAKLEQEGAEPAIGGECAGE